MKKDLNSKNFFDSEERIADLVNGLGCGGRQSVSADDIQPMDTQIFFGKRHLHDLFSSNGISGKSRDIVKKIVLGIRCMVIGIENQETIDYSIVLRNLVYDAGEYERQAAKIRRSVRKHGRPGIDNSGEYMYGFTKESRLNPAVTFILYYGEKEWDGPRTLWELLDMKNIPDGLSELVADYRINLVEVRKLENTDVFRTDVRQVFDYIKCSGDWDKLKELVSSDPCFEDMEEDAFDMAVEYAGAESMMKVKDRNKNGGKVNMCKAIMEMQEESRQEGISQGISQGIIDGRSQEIYEMGREFGLNADQIREKLCSKLNITYADAAILYDKLSKH